MKHVAIMPLIGGLAIGAARALGRPPEAIIDLEDEKGNVFGGAHSSSLRRWWPDVPYLTTPPYPNVSYAMADWSVELDGVDVTHSVPPCGGLSMANDAYARGAAYRPENSPINQWMFRTAELAMLVIKPRVHIMENAIAMGTPRGRPVLERLSQLADKYGYSVTVAKVDTANHGIPQRRRRTFTMFWRDGARAVDLAPFLRTPPRLKDYLGDRVTAGQPHAGDYIHYETFKGSALMQWVVKRWGFGFRAKGRPHYRNAILQMIVDRGELGELIEDMADICGYTPAKLKPSTVTITKSAVSWHKIALKVKAKTDRGLGFRRDAPVILRDVTPTVINCALYWWLHPTEDRFLSVREVMDLMGLPDGFRLDRAGGAEPIHITQNVPTNTAEDMVRAVVEALESDSLKIDPPLRIQDFSRLEWLEK